MRRPSKGEGHFSPLREASTPLFGGSLGRLYEQNIALRTKHCICLGAQASGPWCLCKCVGSGPLTWMDFRPTAPWRGVQWKADEWRLWPQRRPSPVFEFLQHSTPWPTAHDWLHCKYLGHDQLVYGSILSLLVRHVLPGDNAQANLAQIWRDIQWHYFQFPVPVRYKYLTKLSMFERKPPAYPKLRGKGAEVTCLRGPLLYCW